MPPHHARQNQLLTGFTLIELLVVISIISILVAILLPTLAKARMSAQTISCATNIRQLGVSVAAYLVDFNNIYPLGTERSSQEKIDLNWTQRVDKYATDKMVPFSVHWSGWKAPYRDDPLIPKLIWDCPTDMRVNLQWYEVGGVSYFANAYLFRGWRQNSGGEPFAYGVNNNGEGHTRAEQVHSPSKTMLLGHSARKNSVTNNKSYANLYTYKWGWKWEERALTTRRFDVGNVEGWIGRLHNGSANYLAADGHVELLPPEVIAPSSEAGSLGYDMSGLYFAPGVGADGKSDYSMW